MTVLASAIAPLRPGEPDSARGLCALLLLFCALELPLMTNCLPHAGHFAALPIASSATFSRRVQCGHATRIGIGTLLRRAMLGRFRVTTPANRHFGYSGDISKRHL